MRVNHTHSSHPGRLFLAGLVCLGLLSACSAGGAFSPTITPAVFSTLGFEQPTTSTPAATDTPVQATATLTPTSAPSATATAVYSAVVAQALSDAVRCLGDNLTYAPGFDMTTFCPGYWSASSSNLNLYGSLISARLLPALGSASNIVWSLAGVADVSLDTGLSTVTNQVYTARLSTVLSANAALTCPAGQTTPAGTAIQIPIQGKARFSVYNYASQAQEYIRIDSWIISGNPLEEYCSGLH